MSRTFSEQLASFRALTPRAELIGREAVERELDRLFKAEAAPSSDHPASLPKAGLDDGAAGAMP